MELKVVSYVFALLFISFIFFFVVASWLKTDDAYTDMLLTIALVHFVMSKLVIIKREEG